MISKKGKVKKESRFQEMFLPVIIGIIFVGAMTFLIVSNIRITQKRSQLTEEINNLEQQVSLLEELKTKYEQGLISTEEAAYWEEKLREQGYKKPGEEAVVVLPSDESGQETAGADKTFWEKLKSFFGL